MVSNYYVDYQMVQTGSRISATSKTGFIVTVNGFQHFQELSLSLSLSLSLLDIAGDLELIIDIFASQSRILISLELFYPSHKIGATNCKGIEDDWLLCDRNILISNRLTKKLYS